MLGVLFALKLRSKNPFPSTVIQTNRPYSWKLATALAKGISLAPSSVHVNLLVQVSSMLNAVKLHYSGILAVFANLIVVQHGATGDGKSINVWFASQVAQTWQRRAEKRERILR